MARPSKPAVDLSADDTVTVMLPSGSTWQVYPREVAFFNERANRYRKDYALSNISDLAELDRVLQFETLSQRYMIWQSDHCDYWGEQVNPSDMADLVKKNSTEIRMIKQALGIDKLTRDRQQGDDSVSQRWADIVKRAGEFKVLRNDQFDMALELANELIAKVILADRCDLGDRNVYDERKMLEVRDPDIVDWIRNYFTPRYRKIDADFRVGEGKYSGQRMWVEDLNR